MRFGPAPAYRLLMANLGKSVGSSWAVLSLPIAIVVVLIAVWIKSWATSEGLAQAMPLLVLVFGACVIALIRLWKPTT